MHPLTTAPATSFLLTLLLFLHLTTSFSSNGIRNLPNCNQTFSCGTLTNITYPFTGGQRPSHCGLPELRLACVRDSITTLTANSLTYRVTQLSQTTQTLRLSRFDFDDDSPCPNEFTVTTLDDKIFSFGSDHETLSLFYGCKNLIDPGMASGPNPTNYNFSCDIEGDSKEGFFMIGNFSEKYDCQNNTQVPILKSQVPQLMDKGSLVLGEVLREGFDVSYSNPYSDDCKKCCKHSDRHCGFDAQSSKPICICNDQLCPEKSNNRKPLTIGLSVASAAFIGICMGCWIFVMMQRKKRKSALGRESSTSGIAMNFRLKNLHHVDRLETFVMDYHSLTPKRYSYSDIKKMTYTFTNKLGQGGFGNVYKGKLPDGRLVAVKVLKESTGDGEEFMNEVASISRTSHVNIVTLLGFCYERTKRALIFEFMPKGSLDKFVSYKGSPHTNCRLEWKLFYQIAVGIARGLEYLHRGCNTRIVHFDIKPHNILLDEDFCPKISDFGLAKLCKSKVSKVSIIGTRGTAGYIAPEVFCRNFGGVTYKSDVYSYGMMVLEMVGERKDFDIESLEGATEMYFPDWFYKHLEPGEISRLHESITEDEEEIVKKMILVGLWCIQTNPSDRPSMTKVVEMLEGSLQFMEIPPRPVLSSPKRSSKEESSSTSFPPSLSLHSDEQQKSPLHEADLRQEPVNVVNV